MSAFTVREAYVPDLAASRIRSARPMTRVGAVDPTNASTETKVDLKTIGLYVGLPAVGAAALALFAGFGSVWAVGAGLLGGGGGYLYLDYEEAAKKKQAAENAAAAAAAAEKTKIANLDVDVVATQGGEIGAAVKAGLGLFNVGFVPGGTGKDYTLATFTAPPTDATVKQLTDLQKMLSDAGYTTAASQIALAASAAAKLRDAAIPISGGSSTFSSTLPV